MQTLYWHDYETWGVDPSIDRPCQFAGVRTDEDLNILGEPLQLFCRPAPDVLPTPEACLITGISPQKALQEGLPEHQFIARIHQELARAGTCGVGYNSLRFDDEVTRFTLFRNFYDPYEREWKNGCGRWDIIDMVRLCYALRPNTLEWPLLDGKPSFKLELLTQANNIDHGAAHDAYSDVAATIALAKLIRERQPQLYAYVYAHRHKNKAVELIDLAQRKPVLHISSRFSAENGCAGLMMPLCYHPLNKNAVIMVNLAEDPQDLISLDAEHIAERVFTAQADLPEGRARIGLKAVHLNKCPILITPKMLDAKTAKRLNIDRAKCEQHWQTLLAVNLVEKIQRVFSLNGFAPREDPERRLYDGFISPADKRMADAVRGATGQQLQSRQFNFQDLRLREILLRYKARNFPDILTEVENSTWLEFCQGRLLNGDVGCLSIAQLKERIRSVDETQILTKSQKIVLQQLYRYADDLAREHQLKPKCCL